jgi:DNA polymerase III subunit delta'
MPFSSLIGNERIKKLLKRAVQEGRIAQGLIMAGQRGIGKRQFALALAQAVNCLQPKDGDACGICAACQKIALNNHIDVETISPDGQFIKIGQMRDMIEKAQYRPYDGRRRVYIIDEADRLNQQAANSILKVLEEPPDTTLLALVTSRPYALLETIRSRCQILSFAPLTPSELETHLKAHYKRPAEETRMLARLARGSIGRALEIDLGVYRDERKLMLEIIESLAVRQDAIKLMSAAEHLGRKLEKAEFEKHLEAMMTLLEDLFHLKLGEPASSITNADISDRLGQIAETATIDQISKWAANIEAILQSLPRNVNRQLAMEAMLLST